MQSGNYGRIGKYSSSISSGVKCDGLGDTFSSQANSKVIEIPSQTDPDFLGRRKPDNVTIEKTLVIP